MSAASRPYAQLEERLGCTVEHGLLEQSLTHRSFAYENGGLPTNERLEFLGDSVLGLVVTTTLYRTHPDLPEGQLAKLRAAVVNTRALAEVARELELGAYLRLGRGEEATGGRDKSSILADTVEAVLGAVYLDRGLARGRPPDPPAVRPVMAASAQMGAGLDWKTSLQELTAATGKGVPEYRITEAGPDHAKSFQAAVLVAGPSTASAPDAARRRPSRSRPPAAWRALTDLVEPRRGRAGPSRCPPTAPPAPPDLCQSSPRSRSSGAGWSAGVTGRTIQRVEVMHPRAVRRHEAGSADFAARLVGRTVLGRRAPGQVPLAAARLGRRAASATSG